MSNREHRGMYDEGIRRLMSTAGLRDKCSKLQPNIDWIAGLCIAYRYLTRFVNIRVWLIANNKEIHQTRWENFNHMKSVDTTSESCHVACVVYGLPNRIGNCKP
jgi:hypothetical protein